MISRFISLAKKRICHNRQLDSDLVCNATWSSEHLALNEMVQIVYSLTKYRKEPNLQEDFGMDLQVLAR
jgi:hypothetical protein